MEDLTLDALQIFHSVSPGLEVDTITAKEGKVGIPKSMMFPKGNLQPSLFTP
jgi:hypothetical protein